MNDSSIKMKALITFLAMLIMLAMNKSTCVCFFFCALSVYECIARTFARSCAYQFLLLSAFAISRIGVTMNEKCNKCFVVAILTVAIYLGRDVCVCYDSGLILARILIGFSPNRIIYIEALICIVSIMIWGYRSLDILLTNACSFLEKLGHECILFNGINLLYQTQNLKKMQKEANISDFISKLGIDTYSKPKFKIGVLLHTNKIVTLEENSVNLYVWKINILLVTYTVILFVNQSSIELLKKEKNLSQRANIQFSSCAHEIRNPLNSLTMLVKLVKDNITKGQSLLALKNLKIVKFTVQHALLIAKNLLDIGVLNQGFLELHVEKVALHSILHSVYRIFKDQMKEKNIVFELVFDTAVPEYINTDKMRLTQILINLINNALKFTIKGSIKLSASVIENDYIQFTITDTGIGIKKEYVSILGNAFTMIEQNNKSLNPQGIGLGLMISKTLASLIGKGLYFESEENSGTKFWFTVNTHFPVSTLKVKKDNDTE